MEMVKIHAHLIFESISTTIDMFTLNSIVNHKRRYQDDDDDDDDSGQ